MESTTAVVEAQVEQKPRERTREEKKREHRESVLTPNPRWVEKMEEELRPMREALLQSPMVQAMANGTVTFRQMKTLVREFYPFIHRFPKFLALNLLKAEDDDSQGFLIDNIRTEKGHAQQWRWMAREFGVSGEELDAVEECYELHALSQWIWAVNSDEEIAVGVSATSYAIEGMTGEITTSTIEGLNGMMSRSRGFTDQGMTWWRNHAHYDDIHPYLALEVIKRYAKTEELQRRVVEAAKRSIEYLHRALDACFYRGQA